MAMAEKENRETVFRIIENHLQENPDAILNLYYRYSKDLSLPLSIQSGIPYLKKESRYLKLSEAITEYFQPVTNSSLNQDAYREFSFLLSELQQIKEFSGLAFTNRNGFTNKINWFASEYNSLLNAQEQSSNQLFQKIERPDTYLFVWNPKKWEWKNLEEAIEQVNLTGRCMEDWSCGNTKSIRPNDRIFLVRVGEEPKGIIAAGFVTSNPYLREHWNDKNKEVLFVDIEFETLLNPDKEPILSLDILNAGNLGKQHWTPQASGISIKHELVDELEAVWFDFLKTQNIRHNPFVPITNEPRKIFKEGIARQVIQNRYERNPHARKACIKHYGCTCVVCEFNFEKHYGQIGKDFIHVHHLELISGVGKEYEIDPIKDLRPVCPNCHAMLHTNAPPMSIEDLKTLLK